MSMLFAYMAGGEGVGGGGSEVLKSFVTWSQIFFYLLCVCGGGGRVRFSTSPYVKKITDPLLVINDGPYNKKLQGSLRRLSFFKILLVAFKTLHSEN